MHGLYFQLSPIFLLFLFHWDSLCNMLTCKQDNITGENKITPDPTKIQSFYISLPLMKAIIAYLSHVLIDGSYTAKSIDKIT